MPSDVTDCSCADAPALMKGMCLPHAIIKQMHSSVMLLSKRYTVSNSRALVMHACIIGCELSYLGGMHSMHYCWL